jgi:putative nucleotidyltransferase with HDIG domain
VVLGAALLDPIGPQDVDAFRGELPARLSIPEHDVEQLIASLVSPYVVANQLVDEAKTEEDRQIARDNVLPVRVNLTLGQVIVNQGETVDASTLEALQAAGLLDVDFTVREMAALAAVAGLVALLLGWYLFVFQPRELISLRRQLMLVFLMVLVTAATKLAFPIVLPDADRRSLEFALPVAAIPMLVAALLEVRLALFVTILTAVVVTFGAAYAPDTAHFPPIHPLDSLRMLLVYLVGGVVGVFSVNRAERFSRYLLAGLAVGAATWAVLGMFWLLDGGEDYNQLAWISAVSGLCGLAAAVITLGSFVFLSTAFGITTRLQLMELAQMNSPLLRRLQDEAPGTFHHSIIVSNLAERAADLIGADSLLVRVGCYYHDIGKVAQPAFYIENQLTGENPHDHMDPYTSAKIIADHVRNGVELERRYGVPAVVQQFTREHHGTRLVAYFYRKAAEEEPDLDTGPFQYPGPRPRSKETAIVMLADSVEATVRASRERSRDRIDEMVETIIAERLVEQQLDDSDLTLREIRIIAESFKATLRAVYHPRIEYPAPTEAERRARLASAAASAVESREPAALPPPPVSLEERGRGRGRG